MMAAKIIDAAMLRRKRAIRMRIGRSRRRIVARLHATHAQTQKLTSWRTYVVRYPGWALAAALGLGMAASAGFRNARPARWLGLWLTRRALGGAQHQLWNELARIWTGNGTSQSTDDERTC